MKKISPYIIRSYSVGELSANCYIAVDHKTQDCIIVDPGDEGNFIAEEITRMGGCPRAVFLTHGHFDHVLGAFELQTIFAIPVYVSKKDVFLVRRMQETAVHYLKRHVIEPPPVLSFLSKKSMQVGSIPVSCLETPGHTPGSMSYVLPDAACVFTGDTLFSGGAFGQIDHAYSSKEEMESSIRMLLSLPMSYTIYPGHGEPSTIKKEKAIWKKKP